MNHIYCLLGKSCSGKDTLYKELQKKISNSINFVVRYTTRPRRLNECDGKNYHFISSFELAKYKAENKIFESESFDTHGEKYEYATGIDSIDLTKDSIIIVSFAALKKFIIYYGVEIVIGICLEASDEIRFQRSLERYNNNSKSNIKKIWQRMAQDEKDFSNNNIDKYIKYKINTEGNLQSTVKNVENIIIMHSK